MDLDALLEEDLLSKQVGDAGNVTNVLLDQNRSSVTSVVHDVPVSKKGNLEVVRALTDKA